MKAPFNFVPLSEEVFFPDWAEEISHDIPFSDGRSGILRLKITAKTPIFVRNGHTREDKEYWTDDYKSFCHTPDGRFFIPATSLKGMVRNILEIASFGKMSHITNKRYSLRDLHLKAYLEYFRTHEVRCGWMRIDRSKGEAVVEDHGIPGRISAKDVDEMLGLYGNQSLENFVKEGNLRTEKNRSAVYKYKQIVKNCNLHGQFVRIQNENDVDPRKKYRSSSNGEPGVVVLTGQPGKRQEKRGRSTGKFYEFIFFDKEYGQLTLDINQENGVYDDFCFIYQDSDDWKYWKNKDRIPVFFTVEDGHISYMGLSYLFKLPFKKHLKDFLNKKHLDAKLDLAECIFGTVEGDALKGRVQFSHAFCRNPKVGDILYPYMGSPKPTYYPIYTQQNGKNGMMFDGHRMLKYKTFLDDDAKLRGWKRYPVREAPSRISEPIPGQEENTSPFEPLDAGCEFLFTVRYHNLREKELAALVFALNVSEKCLYSLGFASHTDMVW